MDRRNRIWIIASFQRWFVINFLIYSLLFLFVLGLGLFVWLKFVVEEVLNVAGLLSSTLIDIISDSIWTGVWLIGGLVIVLLGISAAHAILFGRKIAGPIYSFEKHLQSCVEAKKLSPLKLRSNDVFLELAEKFNEAVDSVQSPEK